MLLNFVSKRVISLFEPVLGKGLSGGGYCDRWRTAGDKRGMKMGEELLYGKEKSMKLTKSAEVWE
jgi:hypothetical protein